MSHHSADIELCTFHDVPLGAGNGSDPPPPYTSGVTSAPPRCRSCPTIVNHQNAYCKLLAYVALALLFVGGQIPVYMFGSVESYIHDDLGREDLTIWYAIANLIAMAAVTPFAGAVSDIIGRLPILLAGAAFMIAGLAFILVCDSMGQLILYMTLTGIGAGMVELGTLLFLREMASKRAFPLLAAGLFLCLAPFYPIIVYAHLIARSSDWRYCALLPLSCVGVGFLLAIAFCRPQRRGLPASLTRWEMMKGVDYAGSLLGLTFISYMLYTCFQPLSQNLWSSSGLKLRDAFAVASAGFGFASWKGFSAYRSRKQKLRDPTRSNPSQDAPGEGDPSCILFLFISAYLNGVFFYSLLAFWPAQYSQLFAPETTGLDHHSMLITSAIIVGALFSLTALHLPITLGEASRKGGEATDAVTSCVLSMVISLLCTSIWGIVLHELKAGIHPGTLSILMLFFASTIGAGFLTSGVDAALAAKHHHRGVITGTTLSLRTIGGFHGYAILQTIFRHSFHSSLEALLRSIPRLPAARSAQAAELVATIATSSTPATVLADLRRLAASLDLGDVGDVDLPGEGRKLLMHSYQEVWLGAVWFALAAGAVYLVGCYFWRTRRGEAKKKRRDGDRNGNATGNANGNANAAANRNARDTRSPRRMGLCVSGLIFTGLLLLYVFLILMLYLTFPEGGERTRADGSRPSLGAANGSAVVPLFRGSGRGRW